MASAGLNEESVEKKLMSVTNTQDSIQGLSLWIIHHKTHHGRIVELWYKVMKKSGKPAHRLTLFYLCNDVVQTCKRKKANVFVDTFKTLLRQATVLVRDDGIRPKVERIFNIWEERQVFDKEYVSDLRAILDGKAVDDLVFKKPHSHRDKSKDRAKHKTKEKAAEVKADSPVSADVDSGQMTEATQEAEKQKEKVEEVDTPSEEVLAAFKPSDMIEKIRTFKHQEAEVNIKVQQLSHLKLDASSIEAIKQLKDRAHGNEFSTQFEESCVRLEEAVRGLEKKTGEQKDLMAQLFISEFFYDQQYREARIVAYAYKNYGSRINTMKRKLDELSRTLPGSAPSPTHEAPSPGNTPPYLDHSEMENNSYPPGEDDDVPSPPDEAPSPVGSSPGDTPTSLKGGSSSSLENRLANFIPSLQSGTPSSSEERPIPVYVPQPLNSSSTMATRRPSANKTLTEPDVPFPPEVDDQEGGGTPLTDERPSTPVMDEEEPGGTPSPPPPPPPLPPPEKKRKENPIDFLSRLISQTQKSKPAGPTGSSASFLESFSLLTKVKESVDAKKVGGEDEDSNPGGGSPGPRSWKAWKAEKAAEEAAVALPVPPPPVPVPSYVVVPPPPPPPVSRPAPMMVPPPMSMHPPPMTAPPPPSPSNHPSFYQHTSPGQKENWPEMGGEEVGDGGEGLPPSPQLVYPPVVQQDEMPSPPYPPSIKSAAPVKGILRKTSTNSVLKELTPGGDDLSPTSPTAVSSSPMVPPPPPPPPLSQHSPMGEVGNVSAITTLGSGSSSEAQEFMEKLKRKTSFSGGGGGGGPTTPPAYTPNPIRPNLMTLTPGGEMDMDIDEEDEEEGDEGEEEEEEDSNTRIPVLSSVVRRVDPIEQKHAREKEMQQLRDRESDGKHDRGGVGGGESRSNPLQPSSSSNSSPSSSSNLATPQSRGGTFHKERRYSREGRDSYYPSSSGSGGYDYHRDSRESRSYSYDQQSPYYHHHQSSYSSSNSHHSFYGEGSYNNSYFGPTPPKMPFNNNKQGNQHRGGNRRNYHY